VLAVALLALAAPASAGPPHRRRLRPRHQRRRRDEGRKAMAASRTLAKLARSHSVAIARKSVQRYGGRCDARALWHNDISKSTGHRSNILYRRANLFGVGTCIRNGVIWVTVNFEKTTPG
jgi:uncharacterized protein YkwD